MIMHYGTWEVKFCVANLRVNSEGVPTVSYYAFMPNAYGLHLVEDINDEHVLWYDTAEEAKKHILNNEGECVISKGREIKKKER